MCWGSILPLEHYGIICYFIIIIIYYGNHTPEQRKISTVLRVQLNLDIYLLTNLTHLLGRVVMLGDSLKSIGELYTSRNSIIYSPWTRRISI